MTEEKITWEFPDTYRYGYAEVGDFKLIVKGGRPHEFGWVVFHNNDEVASSRTYQPCRSVPEAQRITTAVYHVAKNFIYEQK